MAEYKSASAVRRPQHLRKVTYTPLFLAAMLVVGLLAAALTALIGNWYAATRPGWHYGTGDICYLILPGTHTRVRGPLDYEGERYLFGDDGMLVRGWGQYAGGTYYGDAGGHPVTGERVIDGVTYHFDEQDGQFRAGLYDTGAGRVGYSAQGFPLYGYSEYGGSFYYFDEAGLLQTGWVDVGGVRRYYAAEDGTLLAGWQTIGEETYYFQPGSHELFLGEHHVDGAPYYFDAITGAMYHDGFVSDGESTWYAGEDGVCLTGWQDLEDGRHFFGLTGRMAVGYRTVDGALRRFTDDGVLMTGFQTLDGLLYYFGEDGAIRAGSYEYDGEKRLFDATGAALHGWETLSGSTYYYLFGVMQTGEVEVDGETFNIGADGIFRTGLSGDYAYDDHGYMLTGWQTIDGLRYHFGDDGVMSRNTTIGNYKIGADGVATRILRMGNSVRSCFNWVRSYLHYVRIPAQATKQEILQYALDNHRGACYHYATLLNYALNQAGIQNTIVWGTNNNRGTTHCWNILANGMVVDACNNRYMITQEQMAALGYTPNWYQD